VYEAWSWARTREWRHGREPSKEKKLTNMRTTASDEMIILERRGR